MSSPKRLARTAGLLYLIVAVFAAFAFNYATGTVYVPGDAAATAQRLMANGGLVRAGVVVSFRDVWRALAGTPTSQDRRRVWAWVWFLSQKSAGP